MSYWHVAAVLNKVDMCDAGALSASQKSAL